MYIQPGKKPNRASVRFDSLAERFEFGFHAPWTSAEFWRHYKRTGYAPSILLPFAPYSDLASDYPQKVDIPIKVLARAAGILASFYTSPHPVYTVEEHIHRSIVHEIGQFFVDQALDTRSFEQFLEQSQ
ncbi:MAG TPA: hypothetical protein VH234_01210 [Candidatus Saccharimonadales bacterium]|jgi:hypothetical protein|nr:hypothetical protein [Candidatus Saccharimonadales bacterium]